MALAKWRGGEYLKHFDPQFNEPQNPTERPAIMAGIPAGDTLYFPDTMPGVDTPGTLFAVLSGLLARPAEIQIPT